MNFADVKLDVIIDDNPLKQELYTPGTNIPIESIEHLKSYNESDKIVKAMKRKLGLLLCWMGIHRYKVIDISFGFAAGDSVRTIKCKICGIKKITKE